MKEIKAYMEAHAITTPTGIVENLPPGTQGQDIKKKMRDNLKEFLKTGQKGDSWSASEAIEKSTELKEAIGAQTASSAIPSIWSAEPEILSPEGADGYFLASTVVQWKKDIKGKPGQVVYVQTIAPVAAADITSGNEPTFTASTVSSVPVTLTQKGHGFYISKADLEDVEDGTVDSLVTQSKNAVLRALDGYFLSAIQALAGNAGAGTVAEAGAMAATCLPKLWGSLMAGSYAPAAVLMHPVPFASLLKDSQFINAATYGKSVVIETGKIPRFIGMDIVPLIQGTLAAASGGTYRSFMLAKGVLAGAVKRDLDIEKEYYVKDQRNYNVVTIRFGGTVIHTSGIGLITTVNG